ncbi:hypothetical protein Hanom_Chr11g01034851 [Helianthus anomalus]
MKSCDSVGYYKHSASTQKVTITIVIYQIQTLSNTFNLYLLIIIIIPFYLLSLIQYCFAFYFTTDIIFLYNTPRGGPKHKLGWVGALLKKN